MSYVNKEITLLLSTAVEKHDVSHLQRAFERLKLVMEEGIVLGEATRHHTPPDLYLFTAEAALASASGRSSATAPMQS